MLPERPILKQRHLDDWIRRASRHNVRITDEKYQPVDKVFFKRQDSSRWHGPGKVIGQDGNGDQLVRVSKCRIVNFGSEFQAKDQNCMKKGLSGDHGKINDDKRYHSESDDEYDSTI